MASVTGRAKSPPRSKPSYEEITPEKAYKPESYEPKKAPIIPGDLPRFKIKLPKVVELEEGDWLRLEALAEGLPKPTGKLDLLWSCEFIQLFKKFRRLYTLERFYSLFTGIRQHWRFSICFPTCQAPSEKGSKSFAFSIL